MLIVEHFSPVAQVLTSALEDFYPRIMVTSTLAETLRLPVAREPFDVVICDHTLPDGSGHEVKRWLDSQTPPGHRRSAFVLMAGSLPGFRRAMHADVVLLPKPFTIEDLFGAIREACEAAAEVTPHRPRTHVVTSDDRPGGGGIGLGPG